MNLLTRATLCLLALTTSATFAQTQLRYNSDKSGNMASSVSSSGITPAFSGIATNRMVRAGDTATFSVVVTNGTGPITYQWKLNGTSISGATNATYKVGSAALANVGTYTVLVSNATGSATFTAGDLSVAETSNDLFGVAFGSSKFVAVGANGMILTATDVKSWAAATSGTTNTLRAVVYANSLFVAVGDAGTILASTDGATWTTRTSGTTAALNAVVYSGTKFVAVGDAATVVTSTAGTSWSAFNYGTQALYGVTYASGLYVAIGDGGSIWTSSNASQWTIQESPTLQRLTSIIYGNSKFVTVGENGVIVTSTDAITWIVQRETGDQTLQAIAIFGSTFYAFGPAPNNLLSADGIAWQTTSSGAMQTLNAAVSNGSSTFVAVGLRGTIVTVPVSQVHHFEWAAISTQKTVSQSVPVTVTAKDAANNTVTGFTGTVNFSASLSDNPVSTNILGGPSSATVVVDTNSLNYTVGYSFTPNKDLIMTHWRHYAGTKMSLWTDSGLILASQSVTSTIGTWKETPLTVPVLLKAGQSYRVSFYAPTTNTYCEMSHSPAFTDGTINQAYDSAGDAIPSTPVIARWFLADLKYTVARTTENLSITPTASGAFTAGAWSGNLSVLSAGTNVMFKATDTAGHSGISNPFLVLASNDLAIGVTSTPNPAPFSSYITNLITVMSAGAQSTIVKVTNDLPSGVSYVSSSVSQGSVAFASGRVTATLGTIAANSSATVTIVVTQSTAGLLITNTASTGRSEAESNLVNNTSSSVTYVPPNITLIAANPQTEGNISSQFEQFSFTIAPASSLAIYFSAYTSPSTDTNYASARAGFDYTPIDSVFFIPPGVTSGSISVEILPDLEPEKTEAFTLNFSALTNATFAPYGAAQGLIIDDDSATNALHHFVWGAITPPLRSAASFTASFTAKDATNVTVSSSSVVASLFAVNMGSATNLVLTNQTHAFSENLGIYTLGYSFTPTNDIYMTHLRCYAGSKVSVWTEGGYLLASKVAQVVPGSWTDIALDSPIILRSHMTYRVGVLTGSKPYYWRNDGAAKFANGTIDESFYASGDAFPDQNDPAKWYFVGIKYTTNVVLQPSSVTLASGVWSGNVTAPAAGEDWRLLADDGNGHIGFSGSLPVYNMNDMGLLVTPNPLQPIVTSNLVYTVTVYNPGTNASTGVVVTDTLPVDVTFVTAVASQGTATQTSGVVTANLGTINSLASATVTITVTPLVAGASLTNVASVTRVESDANLANNSAITILVPNLSLALQLAEAFDAPNLLWKSGGSTLWSFQTNTTHDTFDAGQSGLIGNSQSTWVESAVRAPGTLTFWWKCSTEATYDNFTFSIAGVPSDSISGLTDWQQKSYAITSGYGPIRWSYARDSFGSGGADTVWLDQVTYTIPPFYFTNSVMLTNGNFQSRLQGTNAQRLFIEGSADMQNWSSIQTNTLGSTNYVTFTLTNALAQPYRFLRAVHRNTP